MKDLDNIFKYLTEDEARQLLERVRAAKEAGKTFGFEEPKEYKPTGRTPVIYLCTRFDGKNEIERKSQTLLAQMASLKVLMLGAFPVEPHLLSSSLDLYNEESERAMNARRIQILRACDEFWAFPESGTNWEMSVDLALANRLGLRVRFFNDSLQEFQDDPLVSRAFERARRASAAQYLKKPVPGEMGRREGSV